MLLVGVEGDDGGAAEGGICFVETKNLDGETNLKHKLAPKALNECFAKPINISSYLN